MRIEVQVTVPPPKRKVVAREPVPRAKLGAVADKLADSPLKEALREMAREDPQSIKRTRSKT